MNVRINKNTPLASFPGWLVDGQMQKPPQRVALVTGLKSDKVAHYEYLHTNVWPAVTRIIKERHIRNFSIYKCEINGQPFLFSYFEYTGTDFDADMARMAANPEIQRWWKETDSCQLPLPAAAAKGKIWSDMTELYYLP